MDNALITSLESLMKLTDYGINSLPDRQISVDRNTGATYLTRTNVLSPQGYDCLTASLIAYTHLKSKGLSPAIWCVRDEKGLWSEHYAVEVDGKFIDLLPLYPTVSARHIKQRQLTEEEIQRELTETKMALNTGRPFSFLSIENSSYLSVLEVVTLFNLAHTRKLLLETLEGKSDVRETFEIKYTCFKFENGIPRYASVYDLRVDKNGLASRIGTSQKNFEELNKDGIIQIVSVEPYDLELTAPGILQSPKSTIDRTIETQPIFDYDKEQLVKLLAEIARASVSKNDPCPCDSGKKFKKCCGGTVSEVPHVH